MATFGMRFPFIITITLNAVPSLLDLFYVVCLALFFEIIGYRRHKNAIFDGETSYRIIINLHNFKTYFT